MLAKSSGTRFGKYTDKWFTSAAVTATTTAKFLMWFCLKGIKLKLFCFRSLGGKPGSVTLKKDKQNLIGISIGGGAPLCPCLYVVQVFDNTPAAKDGTMQAGDEIVGVNGKSMRGKTKVDVARAIQAIKVFQIYFI